MKIGISGTHSTGKSTFIRHLRSVLSDYSIDVIGDLATAARGHGFPILRDHTFSSTLWMMAEGITREQISGLKHQVVIVDRPVIEPIGYLHAALKSQSREISKNESDCLEAIARSYAFTYDILIKTVVDLEIPISTEQERDHDKEFRLSADREIEALYQRIGCPFFELRNRDDAGRDNLVAKIQQQIDSHNA